MYAAAAKSLQSWPTLCDPIDGSPPGFPSLGFSSKNTGVGCHFLLQRMKVKSESEVTQLCRTLATPWTAAYQSPLPMGFSRQKYWSGVPLPSPLVPLPPVYSWSSSVVIVPLAWWLPVLVLIVLVPLLGLPLILVAVRLRVGLCLGGQWVVQWGGLQPCSLHRSRQVLAEVRWWGLCSSAWTLPGCREIVGCGGL